MSRREDRPGFALQAKIVQPVAPYDNLDDHVPTLPSLGVSRDESSRWQRIASLTEDTYAEFKADARKSGEVTERAAVPTSASEPQVSAPRKSVMP